MLLSILPWNRPSKRVQCARPAPGPPVTMDFALATILSAANMEISISALVNVTVPKAEATTKVGRGTGTGTGTGTCTCQCDSAMGRGYYKGRDKER